MPSEATDGGALRLGDVVRSNIWILVATSLLGLILGFGASTRVEPESTATTPILLTPLDGNPFDPTNRGSQLVNLESEAQSVRSTDVAELANEVLESDLTESQLLSSLAVDVPLNTQILEISYAASDDEVAKTRSQALPRLIFGTVSSAHRRASTSSPSCSKHRSARPATRLDAVSGELSALPEGSARASVLRQEADTLAGQVNTLSTRHADLATTPLDPGQVVTPAAVESPGPLTPALLLPLVGLIIGAAGGLLIGLVRTRADRRIRKFHDVLDSGLALLGTIAWTDPSSTPNDSPSAQNDDDYRKIRVAVLALERRRPFTLLVATASSGSMSPVSVVDLCSSFARAGLDTVVVDRHPATRVRQRSCIRMPMKAWRRCCWARPC